MILLKAPELERLSVEIFAACGAPRDIAEYVSAALVDSSLKGVDSHGVFRVPSYVDQIEAGWIRPAARPDVEHETPSTAIVRGNAGFGIFTLGYATELAARKAKRQRIAAVGLVGATHTGRLGWFAEAAAKQHVLALIIGGGGFWSSRMSVRSVAPYGGAKPIMATNPYAFGVPDGAFGPVVGDFSTSTVAEGKLQVYRARGERVPPGWILDREGNPSTDVDEFYAGGMLLPAAGHKGYSLALLAELIGGALLGNPHELNWFVLAIEIAAFRPIDEFVKASEEFLQAVKHTPPAPGFDEVMLPGEPEARTAEPRAREGIPISDQIWQRLVETARRVGVDAEHVLSSEGQP